MHEFFEGVIGLAPDVAAEFADATAAEVLTWGKDQCPQGCWTRICRERETLLKLSELENVPNIVQWADKWKTREFLRRATSREIYWTTRLNPYYPCGAYGLPIEACRDLGVACMDKCAEAFAVVCDAIRRAPSGTVSDAVGVEGSVPLRGLESVAAAAAAAVPVDLSDHPLHEIRDRLHTTTRREVLDRAGLNGLREYHRAQNALAFEGEGDARRIARRVQVAPRDDLANRLRTLLYEPEPPSREPEPMPTRATSDPDAPPLSPEQQAAVDLVAAHRLCIITGGPGTGKTFLISKICDAHPDAILLAPTATAADRLEGCAAHQALVIEKLLICKPEEAERYVDRVTVIDEAGMVNTETLRRVLAFARPRRLVLVGDPKQLPCQDGLRALHTLLECPCVPIARLETVWRRHGKPRAALDDAIANVGTAKFDVASADDTFRIVQCANMDECVQRAADEYKARGPAQMLAYTRNAVDRVNVKTEDRSKPFARYGARVGDRVVCTKNLYEDPKKSGPVPHMLVSNGTCGTVGAASVRYDNGYIDRGFKTTRFFPCRAMTVHKSQGNEYDAHVIVVVAPWNGTPPIELMYTAISRARTSCAVFVCARDIQSTFFDARFFSGPIDRDLVDMLSNS